MKTWGTGGENMEEPRGKHGFFLGVNPGLSRIFPLKVAMKLWLGSKSQRQIWFKSHGVEICGIPRFETSKFHLSGENMQNITDDLEFSKHLWQGIKHDVVWYYCQWLSTYKTIYVWHYGTASIKFLCQLGFVGQPPMVTSHRHPYWNGRPWTVAEFPSVPNLSITLRQCSISHSV